MIPHSISKKALSLATQSFDAMNRNILQGDVWYLQFINIIRAVEQLIHESAVIPRFELPQPRKLSDVVTHVLFQQSCKPVTLFFREEVININELRRIGDQVWGADKQLLEWLGG
jgi:hypothetical protein